MKWHVAYEDHPVSYFLFLIYSIGSFISAIASRNFINLAPPSSVYQFLH